MLTRHLDLVCDSCCVPCDLDPIGLVGRYDIPSTIKDPAKIKELTYFWVCNECAKDIKTPQDYFTKEYFTEDELFCCENCGKFMSEDELDGLGDVETTICSTCSPKLDESEE